ncbi:YitT family protein [Peribacillus kribbensis]|uniref:YitT family protein n=1 Tax=Peribacillus kribbensis TaxID=356658 RepID=UPI000401CD16|nr:YitT family protein [Peribacillus kribbensis]
MSRILQIILGSIIIGFAYNFFLIPHKVLSSGLAGIAILLGIITPFGTGIINLLLNLPLLILGVMKLGKKFISYTIISVVVLTLSLYVIPVITISSEPILSSVFGGALTGLGIGLIFRASGSSGGFDIIAMLLNKNKDFPLGALISAMNGIVVVVSGFVFNWDAALNTLVGIYVTGKVIDAIHTNHIKLTVMIVTSKGEAMRQQLIKNLYRGVTIMDAQGAYSGDGKKVLMTVITRYQLTDVKQIISETDSQAFVNVTETKEVMGSFHRG